MLFNSYTFFVFFFAVVVLSRSLRGWRVRKLFLLLVSYLFYAAWNPPFVALLWISTLTDWYAAKGIQEARSTARRRLSLLASLVVNLGMLSYFKYGGFLLENFTGVLNSLGVSWSPEPPDIVLPVGISFYTFQTLSYTIDVWRGRTRPWRSFLDYALYVTFFPQLVAGPIVRATDFLPQCQTPRKATRQQLGWGLSLFVVGLFAKVVIADALASPVTEALYDSTGSPTFLTAWAGTLAFSVQIFCDFFGYSTCAVGVALTLGFSLPDNFRFPYAAVGFSDFWRRWHISLSTWLRDYLYIPLGGNRRGPSRTRLNLLLTMLLGGLWHGASWMFVVWGGLHGGYLILERLAARSALARAPIWSSRPGRLFLSLSTFALVSLAWVFFRAREIGRAFEITLAMLGLDPGGSASDVVALDRFVCAGALLLAGGLVALHHLLRDSSIEGLFAKMPWPLRSLVLAVLAWLSLIAMTGEDRAFIYFQF